MHGFLIKFEITGKDEKNSGNKEIELPGIEKSEIVNVARNGIINVEKEEIVKVLNDNVSPQPQFFEIISTKSSNNSGEYCRIYSLFNQSLEFAENVASSAEKIALNSEKIKIIIDKFNIDYSDFNDSEPSEFGKFFNQSGGNDQISNEFIQETIAEFIEDSHPLKIETEFDKNKIKINEIVDNDNDNHKNDNHKIDNYKNDNHKNDNNKNHNGDLIKTNFSEANQHRIKGAFEKLESLITQNKNAEMLINESYLVMNAEGKLLIIAANRKGFFYAIQTIFQINICLRNFLNDNEHISAPVSLPLPLPIPEITIVDFPVMAIRGLSDDISRGQVPHVDNVKYFIKILSKFKLNTYMFYIEDTFSFENYPSIGKNRGALTKKELEEIQDYADKHCVEIVPIFQTVGHMETYFWSPQFWDLAEYPGSSCLNPADPKSYEFLDALLSEIASAFRSKSIHIGCDETYDTGKGKSKEYADEIGLGNLYLKHYSWCIDKLISLGKSRIFLYSDVAAKYKEVLDGFMKKYQKEAVFVVWDYGIQQKYRRMESVVEKGLPFIVSSSALNWSKFFPDADRAILANQRLIEEGLKYNAMGQICSSWGDNGNEDLRQNRLYGFAAASSMSWNFKKFSKPVMDKVFFKIIFNGLSHSNEDFILNKIIDVWKRIVNMHKTMKSNAFSSFYQQLWRHPFARQINGEDDDPYGSDYSIDFKNDVKEELLNIIGEINNVEQEINKINRQEGEDRAINYLDYIKYAASILLFFIEKIQTSKKIEEITWPACYRHLNEEEIEKICSMISPLINKLPSLKETYKKLWLNSAKLPRLDKILNYFDWMIFWYEDKINYTKQGIPFKWPYLLGDWIAHNDDGYKTKEYRYFKYEFELTKEEFDNLDKCILQFVPSTHGGVKINGNNIGRVPYNKESTMLHMDCRILFKKIDKSLLKIGKNTIKTDVIIFQGGFPLFNLNLWLKFGALDNLNKNDSQYNELGRNRTRLIVSSDSWVSSKSENGPWKRVIVKGRPPEYMNEIYAPNFEREWPSFATLFPFGRIIKSLAELKDPVSDMLERMWRFCPGIM